MQALIGGGKYKVTEVLYSDSGLDVCLCLEITVNCPEPVIVNRFRDRAEIRELLPVFYEMTKKRLPRDFYGLIPSDGCVSAVFRCPSGPAFEEYFQNAGERTYEERLTAADLLLSSALELDLLDDGIASRALSARNAVIDLPGRSAGFRYILRKDSPAVPGFRGRRLGGILRKLFPPDRYLPKEIECLIAELLGGKYPTCAAAYAGWRGIGGSAAKTREEYLKESLVKYLMRKTKNRFR